MNTKIQNEIKTETILIGEIEWPIVIPPFSSKLSIKIFSKRNIANAKIETIPKVNPKYLVNNKMIFLGL